MSDALTLARKAARERGDFRLLVEYVPYAAFLGLEFALHEGRPRLRLPYREVLIGNRHLPALHGGVTAAFMESAAMLQLLFQLDSARVPKSIDFAIDYLLPARAEDAWADCEVGRIGSRVAQTTIRCWQKAPNRPVAVARAHFLLGAC